MKPCRGIIMGVGAPNDSVNHGKSMCAIILTREIGMIRVYPIPASDSFPVWGTVFLEIEKGNDPRPESFRVVSYKLTGKVEDQHAKREILNKCTIKTADSDPIDYQNENRASILMVKPQWGDCEFSISQKIPTGIPTDDEECGWIVTQGKHWQKAYVTWTSEQGKSHKSHLGGREIYEGLRKNPDSAWNLMNNLRVNDPDYEFWMLMGNMKDRRNVWLCVHLHRLKKSTSGSIPLFSHPIIGDAEGWPYLRQEDSNVRIVDGHPELFTMNDISPAFCRGNMKTAI